MESLSLIALLMIAQLLASQSQQTGVSLPIGIQLLAGALLFLPFVLMLAVCAPIVFGHPRVRALLASMCGWSFAESDDATASADDSAAALSASSSPFQRSSSFTTEFKERELQPRVADEESPASDQLTQSSLARSDLAQPLLEPSAVGDSELDLRSIHAQRVTVMPNDLKLARRIRGERA
jgi:hypothetical protein